MPGHDLCLRGASRNVDDLWGDRGWLLVLDSDVIYHSDLVIVLARGRRATGGSVAGCGA